jgi:hypothetical protein
MHVHPPWVRPWTPVPALDSTSRKGGEGIFSSVPYKKKVSSDRRAWMSPSAVPASMSPWSSWVWMWRFMLWSRWKRHPHTGHAYGFTPALCTCQPRHKRILNNYWVLARVSDPDSIRSVDSYLDLDSQSECVGSCGVSATEYSCTQEPK